MKNAMLKNAFAEIRKSKSRFISIFGILAIGCGFFAGLTVSEQDMKLSADTYYDKSTLMDFRLLSTYGFDDSDIEALNEVDGCRAYPSYFTDCFIRTDKGDEVVRVYSLDTLSENNPCNKLVITEGRLPQAQDECLIDGSTIITGCGIGDKLTLSGEDIDDSLKRTEYTVVGFYNSPMFIDDTGRGNTTIGSGSIDLTAYVPRENFAYDYYTQVYIYSDKLKEYNCYGEEYEQLRDELNDKLEEIADKRKALRRDEVVADAEQEISDAEKELDEQKSDAEKELNDAKKELDDGKKELDDGKKELDDSRKTLDDAKKEIEDNKVLLDDSERELADGKKELDDNRKLLDDTKAQLEDAKKTLDDSKAEIDSGKKELDDNRKLLDDTKAQLADAEKTLDESKAQIDSGKKELDDNRALLDDTKAQLDEVKKTLDESKAELDSGKKELDENRTLLDDTKAQLTAAKKTLDDSKAQLDSGKKELDDNRKLLDDTKAQLDGAKKTLDDTKTQLDGSKKQIDDSRALIAALQKEIDDTRAQTQQAQAAGLLTKEQAEQIYKRLDSSQTELDAQSAQLDALSKQYDSAKAQYDAGLSAYNTNKAKYDAGEKQYAEGLAAYEDGLKQYNDGLAEYNDGKAKYDAGEKQYAEGYAAYEDGLKQYNDGLAEYNDGKAKYDDGEKQYAEGLAAYEDGLKQYNDGLAEYNDGKAKYEDGEKQYAEGLTAYEDGLKQYNDGLAEYNEGKAKYDDGEKQYAEGLAAYEDGLKEFNDGKAKYEQGVKDYEDGEKQYADGLKEYEDGLKEYEDGLKEYEDGKAELDEKIADAEKEIADARKQLDDLASPEWYVFTREDNPGYAEYGQNADRIHNISLIFPLFFAMVAILVCLTTMTRMVEEQRTQIGTLKALGYSNGAIMFKYMLYGLTAGLLGAAVGILIGMKLFPFIIMTAYGMMYELPEYLAPYDFGFMLLVIAAALVLAAATVYFSCKNILREQPSSLMRPKAPKSGKKILLERTGFIWRHLSFSKKVSMRNLFRYKRRMLMTVVGIAGCTALLLTGFGIYDSVSDILAKQFDEISLYNGIAAYQDIKDDKLAEAENLLKDNGCDAENVYQKQITVKTSGHNADANLFAVKNNDVLKKYVDVRSRINGEKYSLDDQTVIINEKLATLLGGVNVGDSITLAVSDTDSAQATVSAICENYAYHYVYISEALYESLFDEEVPYNCLYFNMPQGDDADEQTTDALAEKLMKIDGIAAVTFKTSVGGTFREMMKSLQLIVVVLIICAGILAFIVLYNLTNININERIRELATLKVLGFYDTEVSIYVFRETVLLTLLGTAAGLLLGRFLLDFVVRTAEIDIVMFGRDIHLLSFIFSIVLTLVFAAAVMLFMHRKLKYIDMVEALKSVE